MAQKSVTEDFIAGAADDKNDIGQGSQQKGDSADISKLPEVTATETFTKTDVESMLAKARADEKNKVYGQLESVKAQKSLSEAKVRELSEKLASLEADLDNVRQGKTSEIESVSQELAKLRDENKKLDLVVQEVASSAAAKIEKIKLDAYRDKLIAEKHLVFTEAVKGDTEEEILASALSAAAKQKEIEEAARKKALEDARKELSKELPKPLAVDGQLGKGMNSTAAGPANREAFARLPREDYLRQRGQLLEEAKRKVGLIE